jgi:hypothetical protein
VVLREAERVRRLLEPAVCFPADDTPVAVYLREGWLDGRMLATRLVDDAVGRGAGALLKTTVSEIVTAAVRRCPGPARDARSAYRA